MRNYVEAGMKNGPDVTTVTPDDGLTIDNPNFVPLQYFLYRRTPPLQNNNSIPYIIALITLLFS